MNNYDFDMSALQDELTRVTVDKKPGAPRKFGNFMDKLVKMPQKDGYVTLRFLPPIPGQKFPYAACRVHNLAPLEERGKKDARAKNVYCGRTLQNRKWVGDCFCCEYYSHLYRLSDNAKAKGDMDSAEQYVAKAQAIKPSEKYYYNAIVMDSAPATGQTPADGPLIYSCGITIHTRILEALLGNPEMKKKSKGNIFHPVNGRNYKIVKMLKPGGQFPDYNSSEWEDPSPLSDDESQIQNWLSNLNDVFALHKVVSKEEMQKGIRIFEGVEQDSRKSFDMGFLSEDGGSAGHVEIPKTPSPSPKPTVTSYAAPVAPKVTAPQPVVNFAENEIEDDPLVDDDFAASVRAALAKGGIE